MLQEHEEVIRKTIKAFEDFEVEREKFYDLLGVEGAYIDALHDFITIMLKQIQRLVGDWHSDWIGYYIYETNYGKCPADVRIGDKKYVIDSVDSLIEVMKA